MTIHRKPEATMSSREIADLTPSIVRELLDYNSNTGVLTWRFRAAEWFSNQASCASWNAKHAGRRAGHTAARKDGYACRRIRLAGRDHQEHRIAWMHAYGDKAPEEIDHVNRDATDNRLQNLRDGSGINPLNQSLRVSSKSGATGVCWRERIGKYQVRVNVGGKTRHIGVFKTLEQAEEAAKKARALTGYSIGHGAPRMLALAGMESSA